MKRNVSGLRSVGVVGPGVKRCHRLNKFRNFLIPWATPGNLAEIIILIPSAGKRLVYYDY